MRDQAAGAAFAKHFDGRRFYNPGGLQARGLLDVLRWKLTSRPDASPEFFDDVEPSKPPARVEGREALATFVNHSTVLLQQSGSNLLTDPIWSERASPFGWIGPRRKRDPGVRREDLPAIDLVLLSHNHYDHLDVATLRWLQERGGVKFVAPLGVGGLLRAQGIEPLEELDWGEAHRFGATTIYSVPAMHFSGRGLFDRDQTLWCGYVIQSENRTVYFAADTGFGEHFARVRERFGAPDLAFLPVGAYAPRWFMSPIHMDPEQAAHAHEVLGARMSIAIHHGTFQLGDDAVDRAKEVLGDSRPDSFLILRNGESVRVP